MLLSYIELAMYRWVFPCWMRHRFFVMAPWGTIRSCDGSSGTLGMQFTKYLYQVYFIVLSQFIHRIKVLQRKPGY